MKLPFKPEAVIFDMDGLLFDTETLSYESTVTAAAFHGHAVDWDFFRTLIGRAWPEIRERMLMHFGERFPADDFRTTWIQHYSELLDVRLQLKAGVLELLDVLDAHRIPRAVATSSPPDKAARNLKAFALDGRFHFIVAHGDYLKSKPEPDPFLKAAERLGVEPQRCLALEDSHNGIRAARAAGMMTIMVPDLLEPTEEIATLCDHVLDDLHQVAAIIVGASS